MQLTFGFRRARTSFLASLLAAILFAASASAQVDSPEASANADATPSARDADIEWPGEKASEASPSANPSRIVFGSCAMRDRQAVWGAIVDSKPDAFLFLGDNIYADIDVKRGTPDERRIEIMRERYEVLENRPQFQAICAGPNVFATWDDHDFGLNDAGAELAWKETSRDIFKAFWNKHVEQDNYGGDDGVYSFQQVGDVQFIMLDTRYNRSPIDAPEGPEKTLLGARQWAWLEEILENKPAKLRIIASSVQVLSDDHRFEKWGRNFEGERRKLLEILRRHAVEGVLFVSGDRHCADITVRNLGAGYNLYDVTSSGISAARKPGETTYLDPNSHRLTGFYSGDNFGAIEIDWSDADPRIELQIRDEVGDVVARHKLRLSQLRQGAAALPVEGAEAPAW
jgi:alkaline phosphatase D